MRRSRGFAGHRSRVSRADHSELGDAILCSRHRVCYGNAPRRRWLTTPCREGRRRDMTLTPTESHPSRNRPLDPPAFPPSPLAAVRARRFTYSSLPAASCDGWCVERAKCSNAEMRFSQRRPSSRSSSASASSGATHASATRLSIGGAGDVRLLSPAELGGRSRCARD